MMNQNNDNTSSNQKTTNSNRINNNKSVQSFSSLGIGTDVIHEQRIQQQKKHLDIELIKPKAENSQLSDEHGPTYDCIMFLIYCTEHDRFAVIDVNDGHQTIWLPFVVRNGHHWSRASEAGLLSMFEKRDPDGMVVNHVNIVHTSKMIELCHLQTVNGRWIQRATQFVTITKCQQTCQPINSIRWMDAGQILKDDSAVWGPEFRKYLENLERQYSELQVVEYSIDSVLRHHHSHHEKTDKSGPNTLYGLIKSRSLSIKLLTDLYEHYLRHTFPSYYMNFGSFKIYLQKCGVKNDVILNHGKQMFRCCLTRPKRDCKGQTYVDFHDICYLLIGLDPELSPDNKHRKAFISHFHEHNQQQVKDLINEENEYMSIKMTHTRKSKCKGTSPELNLMLSNDSSIFRKVHHHTEQTVDMSPDLICPILSKSIFSKFGKLKKKKERLVSSLSRGLCRNCRVKCFEYGQHCIMFDSMGRCVEPKIILNAENQFVPINKLEGKKLYSAEHVFKPDSIGNALFDYMRNRKFLLTNNNRNGLQDQNNKCVADVNDNDDDDGDNEKFEDVDHLNVNAIMLICDFCKKLLKQEPKLIKRSGSSVIIGDIRGNFDSLLTMEQLFWRPIPVIAQNLIFLGNYTDSKNSNYSIETIVYLFSIKYLCPNKVILLKGIQETRMYNEKCLMFECRNRYGKEMGNRIWKAINQVFDEMPFVCIINESIVCTSSGIPKDSIKHKLSILFDSYVLDTQKTSDNSCSNSMVAPKEFALFQHILINVPEYNKDESDHNSCSPATKSLPKSIQNKIHHHHHQDQTILFKPNPLIPNGFIYTKEAFQQFMALNNFSYMIRSNEESCNVMDGYRLSYDNRLISIVSNIDQQHDSVVAGRKIMKNEAVVAFVHHPDSRIQLKQIEHDSQTNISSL